MVAYKLSKTVGAVGRHFFEGAHTLAVSAHGALISLATGVAADQRLVLKHALSGEEQECRVISVQTNPSGSTEVGVEFRKPAPNFWGITFPPSDWVRRSSRVGRLIERPEIEAVRVRIPIESRKVGAMTSRGFVF